MAVAPRWRASVVRRAVLALLLVTALAALFEALVLRAASSPARSVDAGADPTREPASLSAASLRAPLRPAPRPPLLAAQKDIYHADLGLIERHTGAVVEVTQLHEQPDRPIPGAGALRGLALRPLHELVPASSLPAPDTWSHEYAAGLLRLLNVTGPGAAPSAVLLVRASLRPAELSAFLSSAAAALRPSGRRLVALLADPAASGAGPPPPGALVFPLPASAREADFSDAVPPAQHALTDRMRALIEVSDLLLTSRAADAGAARLVETPAILASLRPPSPPGPGGPGPLLPAAAAGALVGSLLGPGGAPCAPPGRTPPELVFHSYLGLPSGYGFSALDIARALIKGGTPIRYAPFRGPAGGDAVPPESDLDQLRPEVGEEIASAAAAPGSAPLYLAYHMPEESMDRAAVPRPLRKARRRVLLAAWETTRVPAAWPRAINRDGYDALAVPSEEAAEAFRRGGVKVPVHVVPLGVDPAAWPEPLPEGARPADGPFRFLMVADGSWTNHRKGYGLAYEAFLEAFAGRDDVELLLKVSHGERGDHEFRKIRRSLPPNVKVHTGTLPRREIVRLMRSAHAFIFPSKGEGFGLPPREAMAMGIPVLVPGFGGLAPIANASLSFPLPWSPEPADGYEFLLAQNDGSSDFGTWARVERAGLVDAMRRAAANRAETGAMGRRAAAWVRAHETYERTADQLVRLLRAPSISGNLAYR
eukprot:tig00021318_g20152.t1